MSIPISYSKFLDINKILKYCSQLFLFCNKGNSICAICKEIAYFIEFSFDSMYLLIN